MPTANRRQWVPKALRYFFAQDYPNAELVIVDDGDSVQDLIPEHDRVKYFRLDSKQVTGTKRNIACEHSSGSLILHWDDDDYFTADRISQQVRNHHASGKAVTGYSSLIFHDFGSGDFWKYTGATDYIVGGTLCYSREFWKDHRFPSRLIGEDNYLVHDARCAHEIAASPDCQCIVASAHMDNTSERSFFGDEWSRITRPVFYV